MQIPLVKRNAYCSLISLKRPETSLQYEQSSIIMLWHRQKHLVKVAWLFQATNEKSLAQFSLDAVDGVYWTPPTRGSAEPIIRESTNLRLQSHVQMEEYEKKKKRNKLFLSFSRYCKNSFLTKWRDVVLRNFRRQKHKWALLSSCPCLASLIHAELSPVFVARVKYRCISTNEKTCCHPKLVMRCKCRKQIAHETLRRLSWGRHGKG